MESVKRMPIVQQVVDKLKEYLFSGEIAVGDKLPVEKELCEQLGVGSETGAFLRLSGDSASGEQLLYAAG